ncbi:Mg2+ transporter protein CorA-like/Zinc transport protein ZntB [Penicillium canariense]|uniref:Mg2+ transporter protein CorA-like/Zinc transport protein ZntB n=1 Tax=Penicillium canariense TaxID=189055 RepID=A0A9W9HQB2_9EURO|nr:Mg2+ transporter protein CorA-like/Zinc transport protein ZntB [Penicillium canariense]KAJ5152925.1 Mg2+ transporter protein CorA-like/Zinc transport protein ZntB [Penicillium canariense]
MTDDQPASRVRDWLRQSGFAPEAEEAENQPRNQNALGSTGSEVDTRDSLEDILRLDTHTNSETREAEEAENQPRNQNELSSTGSLVNTRDSLEDILRLNTRTDSETPEATEAENQHRSQNELSSTISEVDTRDSLEDILRLDPRMDSEAPEAVGLPESQSAYSTEEASARDSDEVTGRSLDEVHQLDTPLVPSTVEVLSSQSSEVVRPANNRKKKKNKWAPTPFTYKDIIRNASKALNHIEKGNLQARPRHDKASIRYYDYLRDGSVHPGSAEDVRELPSLGNKTDVRQRLIVVEDLSQRTINTLGIRFRINPEFFEEHLLNSGYSGADFNQPSSKTWSTASLQKSYVCMKWFRPVWRTPTYFSNRDLSDLLRNKTEHFTHRGAFTTRAETNIFRLEWDLWTDPAKTIRVSRECGWEEKVSIWSGSLPGRNCQIVIVLLDPLPQISEQQRFFKKDNLYEPNSPQEASRLLPDMPNDDGLEEALVDLFGGNEDDLPRRLNERGMLFDFWTRYVMRQTMGKHVDNDPVYRCIIEQMAPRKAVEVDLDRIFQEEGSAIDFSTSLTRTKSTRDEFCDALEPDTGHISLAFPLLQIICRDTFALLKQLRHILDEMDVEIMDDARMEDRLVLWRQIISRAQRELPEFTTSITPFVSFMARIDPDGAYGEGSEHGPDGKLDLKTLLEDIERMTERLRVTSASLTSNMALLDSRRSIDEAHAVTRLTELAFIFIPLSFAASVFGMQIKPFANPVPIWYFFVVAVVATSFSYTMRLVMRSQWLTQMKIDMRADIRKYADKNGKSVQPRSLPVGLILQWAASTLVLNAVKTGKWSIRTAWIASHWIYRQVGLVVGFFLLVGLIIAIPTGILGTRHLSPGIQTAVSLGIVLAIIFTLGAVFSISNDTPDVENIWPRIFTREQATSGDQSSTRGPSVPLASGLSRWLRKCLLWLIPPITVLVIPMALLWTRALSIDMKIGATIGIGVLAFFALAFLVVGQLHRVTLPSESRASSSFRSSSTGS